eukprot:GHUV01052761.1.p1 GENE.GHUV01052761.1~~GHUV01052761.1.p1  ORF type:complete len:131 (+),score=16.67 GHUV01052761.1:452-844(+)
MQKGAMPAQPEHQKFALPPFKQPSPHTWSQTAQNHKIPLILAYYGLCSSTLIVINKVAVHTLEAPVFILISQLLFSAFVVKALSIFGVLEAEGLQWQLAKPFVLIVAGFLGTLYGEHPPRQHQQLQQRRP